MGASGARLSHLSLIVPRPPPFLFSTILMHDLSSFPRTTTFPRVYGKEQYRSFPVSSGPNTIIPDKPVSIPPLPRWLRPPHMRGEIHRSSFAHSAHLLVAAARLEGSRDDGRTRHGRLCDDVADAQQGWLFRTLWHGLGWPVPFALASQRGLAPRCFQI